MLLRQCFLLTLVSPTPVSALQFVGHIGSVRGSETRQLVLLPDALGGVPAGPVAAPASTSPTAAAQAAAPQHAPFPVAAAPVGHSASGAGAGPAAAAVASGGAGGTGGGSGGGGVFVQMRGPTVPPTSYGGYLTTAGGGSGGAGAGSIGALDSLALAQSGGTLLSDGRWAFQRGGGSGPASGAYGLDAMANAGVPNSVPVSVHDFGAPAGLPPQMYHHMLSSVPLTMQLGAASVGGSGPDSDGGGRHSRPPPAALVVMADDGGGDGPGESKGGSGAGGSGDMGERASSPLPTAVAVPDDGVGVRSKADGGEHVRPHPPIAVVVAPERHEGERGGGGGGGEHGGEVPPQQPATNVAAVSEGERRRSDGGESGGHGPSHTAVPMPDSVVPAAAAGGSDGTVGRVDPEADEEECLVAVPLKSALQPSDSEEAGVKSAAGTSGSESVTAPGIVLCAQLTRSCVGIVISRRPACLSRVRCCAVKAAVVESRRVVVLHSPEPTTTPSPDREATATLPSKPNPRHVALPPVHVSIRVVDPPLPRPSGKSSRAMAREAVSPVSASGEDEEASLLGDGERAGTRKPPTSRSGGGSSSRAKKSGHRSGEGSGSDKVDRHGHRGRSSSRKAAQDAGAADHTHSGAGASERTAPPAPSPGTEPT